MSELRRTPYLPNEGVAPSSPALEVSSPAERSFLFRFFLRRPFSDFEASFFFLLFLPSFSRRFLCLRCFRLSLDPSLSEEDDDDDDGEDEDETEPESEDLLLLSSSEEW
jgi:hypothetical protein